MTEFTLSNIARLEWAIPRLEPDWIDGGPEQNIAAKGCVLLSEMLEPLVQSGAASAYRKTYDMAVRLRAARATPR